MPAGGKSTVARELTKLIDFPLIDIDQWMIEREGTSSVKEIIDAKDATIRCISKRCPSLITICSKSSFHRPAALFTPMPTTS